jgi:hypothetical protein
VLEQAQVPVDLVQRVRVGHVQRGVEPGGPVAAKPPTSRAPVAAVTAFAAGLSP